MRISVISLLLMAAVCSNGQNATKHILIEKVTSAGCGGCAYGDYIVDSLLAADSMLIPVHIHWHNATHPDSMFCEDGDSVWMDVATISPGLMVDRVDFSNSSYGLTTSFTEGWQQFIDQRYQDTVFCNVSGNAYISNIISEFVVELNVEFVENTTGDIRVNAYVVKDSINEVGFGYDQANSFNSSSANPMYNAGDPITPYTHKHVLLDMLGGPWGHAGVIPSSVTAGDMYAHTFFETIDMATWQDAYDGNLKVVVLVQRFHSDSSKREILNAFMTDVQYVSGINEPEISKLSVYPNPANDVIHVTEATPGSTITLHDLNGKVAKKLKVRNVDEAISTEDLSPGAYFIKLSGNTGVPGRAKVIITR